MITLELTDRQAQQVINAIEFDINDSYSASPAYIEELEAIIEMIIEQRKFQETEGRGR